MYVIAWLLAAVGAVEPSVVWEARLGFRDFGRIVVVGDVVITGNVTGTGATVALSAATGKLLWRTPGTLLSGPVTDGRAVYTVSAGTGLGAFDVKTGRALWRVPNVDRDTPVNVLAEGGRVYVVDGRGRARAYDAARGALAWEHTYFAGQGHGSCPTTPTLADGVLYYGGGEDDQRGDGVWLWALDAASGRELWRFAAKYDTALRKGRCVRRPAVGDGIVIVTTEHVVIGVDARLGTERWRQAVVRGPRGAQRYGVLSSPVVAGGRVYAITDDALIGWELASGRQAFELPGTYPGPNGIRHIVASEGTLYFVANFEQPGTKTNREGFLYAVDAATAHVRWRHRVNRDVQYVDQWSTRFFAVVGSDVYYENHGFLAKLQP